MKERIVWVLGAVAVVAVIALVINSGKEPEKKWVDITLKKLLTPNNPDPIRNTHRSRDYSLA